MAEHQHTDPTSSNAAPPPVAPETREREGAWRRGRERSGGHQPSVVRPARAALRYAFAALAENVRDYAIFLVDPEGIITFWGEGARLMKWWTREEAEGGHLRLLYPDGGSDDGTAEDHIREAAERGECSSEGRRVRSDGSTFWAGITLTALRDDDGQLLGFAKVTRDLTARRAADAIIKAATEAAETARAAAVAADAAKSGFLATMSHEIRTPINAIIGYHQLLETGIGGSLSPTQREYLTRATASGRHLLMLVNEVLDFSRVDAGHADIAAVTFRLGDAVSAAIDLLEPQARARDLDFVNATSGFAAEQQAVGDAGRVRQVLVNLLANAVKFTAPGGRITVSAGTADRASPDAQVTGRGPWVYVRVEDTGEGIAPERLAAVFEPFVQGDMALTRAHGGTGLGLAISRRLARLMGGDLTARSEPGVGSAFFLWLPAAPAVTVASGAMPGDWPGDPDVDAARTPEALHDLADALLGELEPTVHAYVTRLRTDPEMPNAHGLDEAVLENQFATLLADLANSLNSVDVGAGQPAGHVGGGTEILRLIAGRHGAQRARLGWTEPELRRDFVLMREEIAAAVHRHVPKTPATAPRAVSVDRALLAVDQSLDVAERVSMVSWREERARGR